MITSASDFIGEYNIPNRSDAQTAELIDGFIAKYEPRLLVELLGADLYSQMLAGLGAGTATISDGSPIVDGVGTKFLTYFQVGDEIAINGVAKIIEAITSDTVLSTTENWDEAITDAYYKGLKWYNFYNLPYLRPAIICYVYYWYRRNAVTSFSGTGEIVNANENSVVVSPVQKMVDRWNEMVKNNIAMVKFIQYNPADYGNYYAPERLYPYPFWDYRCRFTPDIFKVQNTLGI